MIRKVRECQAQMDALGAINPAATFTSGGPTRTGNRPAEFVSDFSKAGMSVLGRHQAWTPRLQLFELYYVRNIAYKQVMAELQVKPGTMDWWIQEIKKAVGPELERRGLWPLRRYFSEPGWLELERQAKDACREDRRRRTAGR